MAAGLPRTTSGTYPYRMAFGALIHADDEHTVIFQHYQTTLGAIAVALQSTNFEGLEVGDEVLAYVRLHNDNDPVNEIAKRLISRTTGKFVFRPIHGPVLVFGRAVDGAPMSLPSSTFDQIAKIIKEFYS